MVGNFRYSDSGIWNSGIHIEEVEGMEGNKILGIIMIIIGLIGIAIGVILGWHESDNLRKSEHRRAEGRTQLE